MTLEQLEQSLFSSEFIQEADEEMVELRFAIARLERGDEWPYV